jgi:hypothetical protein
MQENENSLAELANGTGGTFFHNNNDLEAGIKRLMVQPEFPHPLEVSLKDIKPTGTYHRLPVEIDQAGLQVQARRRGIRPQGGTGQAIDLSLVA